jgi:hypothetical protein
MVNLRIAPGSVGRPCKEGVMLSKSCDFDEFLERVKDRDYLEVIYLADQEATEAERLKYQSRAGKVVLPEACSGYVDTLKGFIRFMRYGVKSPSMQNALRKGIQAFREAALENDIKKAETMEAGGSEG